MAQWIIMPRQGQSVESCIITTWHKKVGDEVKEGDILYSYETDKSAFDEPSPVSGTILAILPAEGDVVPCLDPVAAIGKPGEKVELPDGASPAADTKAEGASSDAPEADEKKATTPATEAVKPAADGERVKISPRAKALAIKTGADLSAAAATGPHGRIIERDVNAVLDAGARVNPADVEAFLRGEYKAPVAAPSGESAAPAAAATAADDFTAYEEVKMNGVRRATAKSMCASLSEMAQLTISASFDASAMMDYRAMLKAHGEEIGLGRITINDMILYAVSRVLPKHPYVNANLVGDTIRTFAHANIGLAVDTERGLLVPTLFGADVKSLSEVSAMAKSAASKARDGALTPDEMSGGSFTVTNLGSMGVESFTPVINPPQTAILGVCAVTNRLKADGSVYPAMGLSLTFDHRVVDGAPAARFLKELCTALENFPLMLAV
jgi:pyruvate dehydrogenase E2 component (dihydrolipoamide acetyltransferase)